MAYNPITNPQNVAINEISTGGGLVKHHLSLGTTADQVTVSGTPGKVTGWYVYNDQTTVARIAFYDATTAPAVGNITLPAFKFAIVVPPSAGANVALPAGIQFTTGISFNIGSSVIDSNTTLATASKVSVNIFYKN